MMNRSEEKNSWKNSIQRLKKEYTNWIEKYEDTPKVGVNVGNWEKSMNLLPGLNYIKSEVELMYPGNTMGSIVNSSEDLKNSYVIKNEWKEDLDHEGYNVELEKKIKPHYENLLSLLESKNKVNQELRRVGVWLNGSYSVDDLSGREYITKKESTKTRYWANYETSHSSSGGGWMWATNYESSLGNAKNVFENGLDGNWNVNYNVYRSEGEIYKKEHSVKNFNYTGFNGRNDLKSSYNFSWKKVVEWSKKYLSEDKKLEVKIFKSMSVYKVVCESFENSWGKK